MITAVTADRVSSRSLLPLAGAALGIGVVSALAPLEDSLGLSAILLAATIIGYLGWRQPVVRGPLLVGFAARAGVALMQAYVMAMPGSGLDAATFELYGWAWSTGGLDGVMTHFTSGAYLYSWIIAVLYAVTDRSPLMIQAINVLFGSLVIWNVFALARMLWDHRSARLAAWVVALFPTLILYSALTMREVAVVYPLTLGALFYAYWVRTRRNVWLAGAMLCFVVAVAFHVVVIGVIAAVLLGIVGRWLATLARGRLIGAVRMVIGFLVAAAVATIIYQSGWGNVSYSGISLETVALQQEVASRDRTAYLQGAVAHSVPELIIMAPVRVVFFLFMPFPWLVRSAADLMGLLDSLLWVWLAWMSFRALPRIRGNPGARNVLFLAGAAIVVFALVVANYGTAIRHRAKIVPLVVAVACAGAAKRESGRGQRAVTQESAS